MNTSAIDSENTQDAAAGGHWVQRLVLPCGVTLYQGDCRKITVSPDNVDCILTDPPYPDQYEEEYDYRANGIDFLNQYECTQLVFWSARFDFPLDHTAIHMWDKKMGAGRAEYERVFERHGQSGYLMFREYFINSTVAANYVNDEYTGHPSQKPRKLLMRMLDRLAKKSTTIYDPFMGSGSTGVAAVRMGKGFIGVERDPEHFETARKRIEAELAQPDLFLGQNKGIVEGAG